MKQRNSSIDAVKGIAIVLVMIGHVFVHNHMEDPYVYDFIKAVQMPLFMLISGYLCGQGRKIESWKQYAQVMGKRALTYLVPFFVWLIIMHPTKLLESFRIIFFQVDYGLWFLPVLFILTFMVYTAQLLSSKLNHGIIKELLFWGIYGFFCVVLVLQILTGNTFLSPYLTILYVPFYMAGYVVGNYGERILCWGTKEAGKLDCKHNRFVQMMTTVMGIMFLAMAAVFNLNSMETKLDSLIQIAASFLGSTAIIYGVLQWRECKIKNIFAKIGEYTLEIYVIHYHFANMLNFNDKQYNFYTLEGFVFVVLSVTAMSAVTFASIWLLKKVKVLDLLLFGRKA